MADLKNIKKGDKVIMRLFTGAFSGVKEVEKVDKTGIYLTTKKGMSKFDIKSGKMVEPAPKSERYANYIEEYDEEAAKAGEKKRSGKSDKAEEKQEEKKPVKKAKKVVKKKATENDVEELD